MGSSVALVLVGCPDNDNGDDAMAGATEATDSGAGPMMQPNDSRGSAADDDTTGADAGTTAPWGTTLPPDGTASDTGDDATTDGPPPPAGWTCDPSYYGTQDGCDCGCGAVDPDCPDASAASCDYCELCSYFRTDDDCSILIDPDDNSMCSQGECGNDLQEGGEVCDGMASLPESFTCEAMGFTGGTPACAADCANLDLTGCTGGPEGWTCSADFFGTDDGCDCGCGVVDPDCADATAASCEFCDVGSCGFVLGSRDCVGIDANDSAVCSR